MASEMDKLAARQPRAHVVVFKLSAEPILFTERQARALLGGIGRDKFRELHIQPTVRLGRRLWSRESLEAAVKEEAEAQS